MRPQEVHMGMHSTLRPVDEDAPAEFEPKQFVVIYRLADGTETDGMEQRVTVEDVPTYAHAAWKVAGSFQDSIDGIELVDVIRVR
jgi:hypothetical protein